MEQSLKVRRLWIAIGTVVVGIHIGLTFIARWGGARKLWGDENAYFSSALAVLQGDPSWWPVPLWPPLYPRFLAGIFVVFDHRTDGVALVQTLLLIIAAAIFGDLVARWTGRRIAGVAAFLMMAGFPPLAAYGHFLWPEVLHLVLVMMVLWVLVVRRDSFPWLLLGGAVLGLALLTKSLLGPFLPVLLGGAFWGDRGRWRWVRPAVFVAAMGVVIGPVIALQQRRIGIPVIADSSAFNLWVGLNDRGVKSFEDSIVASEYRSYCNQGDSFAERNAKLISRSRNLVRERGLGPVLMAQVRRQYFRLFDKDCYLTEQLPGGAGSREGTGYSAMGQKTAAVVRLVSYGSYAFLLLTAPLGFLVWQWPRWRWPRVFLVFLLYNLGLFLVLHVKSRYRIQLLPVFFLGSSGAVAWFENGLHRGFHLAGSRVRLGVAALASTLLLWLAF